MDPDRLLSFDGHANEQLLHDGDVVSLTPKAFAVLRRLVEDAGQLVKKDDLPRSVWRDTRVSDGVLRVITPEIRRALGDDSVVPEKPQAGRRGRQPRGEGAGAAELASCYGASCSGSFTSSPPPTRRACNVVIDGRLARAMARSRR